MSRMELHRELHDMGESSSQSSFLSPLPLASLYCGSLNLCDQQAVVAKFQLCEAGLNSWHQSWLCNLPHWSCCPFSPSYPRAGYVPDGCLQLWCPHQDFHWKNYLNWLNLYPIVPTAWAFTISLNLDLCLWQFLDSVLSVMSPLQFLLWLLRWQK